MKGEILKDKSQLTKAEEKICDYIEEYMNSSIFMTVTEIASNCGVGEATVTRFCKKLGFRSFLEFKMTMAQEYHNNTVNDDLLKDNMLEDGSIQEMMKYCYESTMLLLKSSMKKNTFEQIDHVTELLLQSERICLFGNGRDSCIAQESYFKLMDIGIFCEFAHNQEELNLRTKQFGIHDIVFVIDRYGDDVNVNTILTLAAEQPTNIVSITENRMSKLAILSTEAICYAKGTIGTDESGYDTSISQHYLIDLILEHMIQKKQSKV